MPANPPDMLLDADDEGWLCSTNTTGDKLQISDRSTRSVSMDKRDFTLAQQRIEILDLAATRDVLIACVITLIAVDILSMWLWWAS